MYGKHDRIIYTAGVGIIQWKNLAKNINVGGEITGGVPRVFHCIQYLHSTFIICRQLQKRKFLYFSPERNINKRRIYTKSTRKIFCWIGPAKSSVSQSFTAYREKGESIFYHLFAFTYFKFGVIREDSENLRELLGLLIKQWQPAYLSTLDIACFFRNSLGLG